MRGMIYAVSPEGVIGVGNRIPWRYQGDFRRFKRVTMGKTLIMGRKTFESIGHPLAGRRNIVVTSHPHRGRERRERAERRRGARASGRRDRRVVHRRGAHLRRGDEARGPHRRDLRPGPRARPRRGDGPAHRRHLGGQPHRAARGRAHPEARTFTRRPRA